MHKHINNVNLEPSTKQQFIADWRRFCKSSLQFISDCHVDVEVLLQLPGDPVQFLSLPSGTADESQSFLNPDQSQHGNRRISHVLDCVVVFGCCPGCWNHERWKPEQWWRICGKIVSTHKKPWLKGLKEPSSTRLQIYTWSRHNFYHFIITSHTKNNVKCANSCLYHQRSVTHYPTAILVLKDCLWPQQMNHVSACLREKIRAANTRTLPPASSPCKIQSRWAAEPTLNLFTQLVTHIRASERAREQDCADEKRWRQMGMER